VAPVVTEAPEFVEATRRTGERASFLFLVNHSDTSPATLEVEPGGIDLITGNSVDGPLELPGTGWVDGADTARQRANVPTLNLRRLPLSPQSSRFLKGRARSSGC
jgi:Beta-galactosidase C-terminal domain